MTVGYGDITPKNFYEVIIATAIVIVGCGINAYYINKIGLILQQLNVKNISYQEQYSVLSEYMRKKNITIGV